MPNRTRTLVTVAAVSASLLACGGEHANPKYAKDGDTGAAAPATQQTLSPNPEIGDTSQRQRTGAPAAAGDSSGGGRANRDSATAGRPGAPIPGQPQKKRP